jgi:uncharacterized OB-fold protein
MSEPDTALFPPEFAGFAANAREHRIAFPHCEACRRFHWYPMPQCPHCQSGRIAWKPVSGAGTIFSFTEVRHAFDKSRRDRLPYIVAMVTFHDAPGVRLITNVVGADLAELAIDANVEPVFPPSGDPDATVCFRLTKGTRS